MNSKVIYRVRSLNFKTDFFTDKVKLWGCHLIDRLWEAGVEVSRLLVAWQRVGNMATLSQPPDLAPSDFFLFPRIKRYVKGKRFDTIPAVGPLTAFRAKTSRESITMEKRWCYYGDNIFVHKNYTLTYL